MSAKENKSDTNKTTEDQNISNSKKSVEEEKSPEKTDENGRQKSTTGKHTSRSTSKKVYGKPADKSGNKSEMSTSAPKDEKKISKEEGTKTKDKKTAQRSPNKIYRCPPTPTPEQFCRLERQFTLDCIAVNTTSQDYSQTRPKLGQIIPPYNAQKDKAATPYFEFTGIKKILKKTGQQYPGEPMEGEAMLRFHESGAGFQYLSRRNQNGAGHSRETIDGHAQFMSDIKPLDGYNGRYGYRRTTPALRSCPSTFGVLGELPIH